MNYDRLATFERKTTFDDFGQTGGEWVELFQAYVKIIPLTGRELVESGQVQAQHTHRAWTHWQDGVSAKHRFKIARNEAVDIDDPDADANFRIFQIDSVINVREHNKELELLVTERGT